MFFRTKMLQQSWYTKNLHVQIIQLTLGVLSSEVWQGVKPTDIAMLEHVDLNLILLNCGSDRKKAWELFWPVLMSLDIQYVTTQNLHVRLDIN